eukprot:3798112-Prymnesium_polylepis.1
MATGRRSSMSLHVRQEGERAGGERGAGGGLGLHRCFQQAAELLAAHLVRSIVTRNAVAYDLPVYSGKRFVAFG